MAIAADPTSFRHNPSLIRLYLLLIPGSLIMSAAMGYDSSLMNGIQGVDRWVNCTLSHFPNQPRLLCLPVFIQC